MMIVRMTFAIVFAVVLLSITLSNQRFSCVTTGQLAETHIERHYGRISVSPHVSYSLNYSVDGKRYAHRGIYEVNPGQASDWSVDDKKRANNWLRENSVGSRVQVTYHCVWPILSTSELDASSDWSAKTRSTLLILLGVVAIFGSGVVLLINRLRGFAQRKRHAP